MKSAVYTFSVRINFIATNTGLKNGSTRIATYFLYVNNILAQIRLFFLNKRCLLSTRAVDAGENPYKRCLRIHKQIHTTVYMQSSPTYALQSHWSIKCVTSAHVNMNRCKARSKRTKFPNLEDNNIFLNSRRSQILMHTLQSLWLNEAFHQKYLAISL